MIDVLSIIYGLCVRLGLTVHIVLGQFRGPELFQPHTDPGPISAGLTHTNARKKNQGQSIVSIKTKFLDRSWPLRGSPSLALKMRPEISVLGWLNAG